LTGSERQLRIGLRRILILIIDQTARRKVSKVSHPNTLIL
jgi:hypothetical protein